MKAFVIGRPFHLFNAINFAISNNTEGDAFILNEYANARRDFERVRNAKVFRNVYFVEDSALRPQNKLLEAHFIFERGLFPMRILMRGVQEPDISKEQLCAYSEVYSASPGTFVLSLIAVSNAKYYVLEDGAGTYSGKDFLENQSLKHRLYCKIFRNGALNLKIEGVYVYRPEMCNTELSKRILKLPAVDTRRKDLMDVYQTTFDMVNDRYREKYIFLSQRLLGLNIEMNLPEFVYRVFHDAGIEKYCYRLHPAEADFSLTKNEAYSLPDEMWELLCSNYVDNKKVLITINSSAAFSPFKLYDKEPYVVFIYRVVGLKGDDLDVSEDLVKTLKTFYSDPSKIIVPNNRCELVETLKKLNDT